MAKRILIGKHGGEAAYFDANAPTHSLIIGSTGNGKTLGAIFGELKQVAASKRRPKQLPHRKGKNRG